MRNKEAVLKDKGIIQWSVNGSKGIGHTQGKVIIELLLDIRELLLKK